MILLLALLILFNAVAALVGLWFGLAWFRRTYVIIRRGAFLVVNVTEDDELFMAIPKGLSAQDSATLTRLVDNLVRNGAA